MSYSNRWILCPGWTVCRGHQIVQALAGAFPAGGLGVVDAADLEPGDAQLVDCDLTYRPPSDGSTLPT
jgi:hypothetical protein